MINARRAILAIPLLLAACSTAASPTPAALTAPAATPGTSTATSTPVPPTTRATNAPTLAPSESAGSPTPGASLSGDLASLLPTEIAGNAMTIEPATDSAGSFMILWNDEQIAQDLLDALSASADDIDVVFSNQEGNTFPNQVSVNAYRVAGSDGIALRDGFVENYRAFFEQYGEVTVVEETVSGKEVVFVHMPDTQAEQEQRFYAVGDIVFVVSGTPFEWVEDAFTQLP